MIRVAIAGGLLEVWSFGTFGFSKIGLFGPSKFRVDLSKYPLLGKVVPTPQFIGASEPRPSGSK